MPLFEYVARDRDGNVQRGNVLGDSQNTAVEKLARQGLIVTGIRLGADDLQPAPSQKVAPQPAAATAGVAPPGVGVEGRGNPGFDAGANVQTEPRGQASVLSSSLGVAVKLENLQFFFRQFAAMTKAGVNPAQSLSTLAKQSTDPKLARILREASEAVAAGYPMSATLQRYPEVFSPLMISMVRAGETGGYLDEQCLRLSDYIQQDLNLRNLIRRETFMPKLTLICSIFIILCGNFLIDLLARLIGVTPALHLWSPLTTAAPWFFIVPALILVFVFRRVLLQKGAIKELWDGFILRLPFIGKVAHGFAMAKFGRSFGALYAGGVGIPEATRLAADACGNFRTRALIYPAVEELKSGKGIAETWAKTGAFSPIVLDMARTGEMTGNVDQMLVSVAEYYEDDGKTKARSMAKIYGVILLILVAIYVAYVVYNFFVGYVGAAIQIADPDMP
ncbi:MAG: type II secretion system F family protein [Fimbriimonadaceae bacterium]|nr:type II secretion system F family protein [Fimbriimonadaceae bacterium]